VLVAFYSEESELSTDAAVSRRGLWGPGIAGVEIRVSRLFSMGVEGGYRYLPGILGEDGISKEYGRRTSGGLHRLG